MLTPRPRRRIGRPRPQRPGPRHPQRPAQLPGTWRRDRDASCPLHEAAALITDNAGQCLIRTIRDRQLVTGQVSVFSVATDRVTPVRSR
ncbi:hypothetical protein ACIF6H_34060 [Streptomyces microflavus]|uniref:hypothetical protein n=1 Tax=Streptomyces microflavus TaxID=1919 RepID=UPI0033B0A28B